MRRFLDYLAEQQATKRPVVDSQAVQGFLTHLATRRHVSASTRNQALSAVLFLCRHVLCVEVGGLSRAIQARRGTRRPVMLSASETATLLEAMSGRTWLMAALVYGGGLRTSECSQLRSRRLSGPVGRAVTRGCQTGSRKGRPIGVSE